MSVPQSVPKSLTQPLNQPASPSAVGIRRFASVIAILLALGLSACGATQAPEEPAAGPRVESPELGLALAAVPVGFELASNDGVIRLVRPDEPGVELRVEASAPQSAGINLADALKAHKEAVTAMEEGDYRGQLELGTQIGRAYLSRGRFAGSDGTKREETRAFAVHPSGNRLLELVYSYAAGGQETVKLRREELMSVLGEVVSLGVVDESAPAG